VCGGLATRGHESARLAPPVARRDPFGQATVAGAGIMEPMADSPWEAPPSWPPPDPRQLVPERSSKRRSVDVSWVVGDLRRRRAQLVVGVLAECVAWWAFRVPWDMSEVNRQGQIIERHGDQTMLRLVAALAGADGGIPRGRDGDRPDGDCRSGCRLRGCLGVHLVMAGLRVPWSAVTSGWPAS
jgi:hypothetical protein